MSHLKLGHQFHALIKVCSVRDDIVPLKAHLWYFDKRVFIFNALVFKNNYIIKLICICFIAIGFSEICEKLTLCLTTTLYKLDKTIPVFSTMKALQTFFNFTPSKVLDNTS